jgi:hypothetical protein
MAISTFTDRSVPRPQCPQLTHTDAHASGTLCRQRRGARRTIRSAGAGCPRRRPEHVRAVSAPQPRRLPPDALLGCTPMSQRQLYRLRTPSTGREVLLPAEPGEEYRDRDTGEPMEIVAKILPAASESSLPWAVENLRFCNWCDQLAQKDLNDCPHCGRRMAALPR